VNTGTPTRHSVLWQYLPTGARHASTVVLTPGYTTEVDVPRILAVAHSVDASQVLVLTLGQGEAL